MPVQQAAPADRSGLSVSTNRILAALTPDDYRRVHPHLRPQELSRSLVLYENESRVADLCFVESGMVSLVTIMKPRSSESALVGSEGASGMALFHRMPFAAERAVIQAEGYGQLLPAERLPDLLASCPSLVFWLHRFAFALQAFTAQSSACNRGHATEKRLAKWLLLTADRIRVPTMPLTHVFIAQMLGVRRSTVTVTAEQLRDEGLIDYRRGKIQITDREGLERKSCECYGVLKRLYAAAMTQPASTGVYAEAAN